MKLMRDAEKKVSNHFEEKCSYAAGLNRISQGKYLNRLALDCSRLISSFIRSIKESSVGGLQYKKEKSKTQREREEFDKYLDEYLAEYKKNPEAKFDVSRFEKHH